MTTEYCFNCGTQQPAPTSRPVGKFAWLMYGTGVGCWLLFALVATGVSAGFIYQHAHHFFKGFFL